MSARLINPPHRLCSWGSVALLSLLSAVLLVTGGCASTPAGISGHDAFITQAPARVLSGSRPAPDAAQCFEDQASFLPLSDFSRDPAARSFTYRLRLAGLWFEQVRITPEVPGSAGSGSRADVRVAPNLDARWHADFERDRGAVLQRCLTG